MNGSRLIARTHASLFLMSALTIVVPAQMRERKKGAASGAVDHDSRPDEMMPGTRTTACFFVKPRFFASWPTSNGLTRLLSHSRPGATSSVKFKLPSDGISARRDWMSQEVNASRSKFCIEPSGSPDVRNQLQGRDPVSVPQDDEDCADGDAPRQQADEASEDKVRSPFLAPCLLRFERRVVERRQEALAQVELVEGCLWRVERDSPGRLIERDPGERLAVSFNREWWTAGGTHCSCGSAAPFFPFLRSVSGRCRLVGEPASLVDLSLGAATDVVGGGVSAATAG